MVFGVYPIKNRPSIILLVIFQIYIYISHITSHKIQVQYYVYHRCSCLKTVEDG